jgi:nucleoside-diphosphate kinase
MIERTLVLVKPDGVYRALIGKVTAAFEDAGLKVVGIKMLKPERSVIDKHYVADEAYLKSIGAKTISSYKKRGVDIKESELEIGKRIRGYLFDYVAGKPVVAMVIEGNEAVANVKKIAGATSPTDADRSSIRGRYASDSYDLADSKKRAIKNMLHVSGDKADAAREVKLWFKESELVEYKRVDESLLYD